MIQIKKLPAERWEDYKRLRLEALKNEPTAFGSAWEEQVDLPPDVWIERLPTILFAMQNDTPVGMVRYTFETSVKNKHTANIYSYYVIPAYRNQGIGGRLLTTVIDLIKENIAIRKIKLSVISVQKSAVRLYERQGFVCTGSYKNELCVDGKFYDELIMEKYL